MDEEAYFPVPTASLSFSLDDDDLEGGEAKRMLSEGKDAGSSAEEDAAPSAGVLSPSALGFAIRSPLPLRTKARGGRGTPSATTTEGRPQSVQSLPSTPGGGAGGRRVPLLACVQRNGDCVVVNCEVSQ
jgi:hypothetical protein